MSGPLIIYPDPDSHFRLRPCKCGSRLVAYYKRTTINGAAEWAVGCRVCGKITKWHRAQHRAQIEWNGKEKPSWERE